MVKLATLKTCICAAPEYFKNFGKPRTPADLSRHEWVTYKLTSGVVNLEKGDRSYTVETKGSISTNNAAARTLFVEAGHGLGRIPFYDAWPKIKAGLLETVFDDYKLSDINVFGVFPPGAANSKKLRLLIDYLKEYFESHTKLNYHQN